MQKLDNYWDNYDYFEAVKQVLSFIAIIRSKNYIRPNRLG